MTGVSDITARAQALGQLEQGMNALIEEVRELRKLADRLERIVVTLGELGND